MRPARSFTRRALRPLAAAALLALLAGCSPNGAAGPEPRGAVPTPDTAPAADPTHRLPAAPTLETGAPELRLVVADAEEPAVSVLDLATEEELAGYRLDEPARVVGSAATPFVAVVAPQTGSLSVLDGGSFAVGHAHDGTDFHGHYYVREPRLLDEPVTVPKPGHVQVLGATMAVFSDAGGAAHLLDQNALYDGERAVDVVATPAGHRGVGAPLGDGVVVSWPGPGGAADEIRVVRDGVDAPLAPCPDLDGMWRGPGWIAVGCADGIAVATEDDGDLEVSSIPYPAELDAAPVTELVGGAGDLVAAPSGDRLLVVDVGGGEARVVALPAAIASTGLGPDGQAVVLTADGAVHQVDAGSAELVASAPADSVPVPDGAAPSVVVGGDRAYVASPTRGEVLEFATNDGMRLARTLDVGGAPGSLALLGAPQ